MKVRSSYGTMNIIGRQLAVLRKEKGYKQKEFVAKLQANGYDIHPNSYSKIEGQTREVTDIEIAAIARSLEVPVAMLFPVDVQNPANQS